MAAKKKSKQEDEQTIELGTGEVLQASVLKSADRLLLKRVGRLLIGIQRPTVGARARREGYTREEHMLGWALFRKAGGEERSFDHMLAALDSADDTASPEQLRLLREIDAFENAWFPRTRGIIRRVVPRDARDRFEKAFFVDLKQQPLGPGVIGSVSTYLSRVDGLSSSADPHAKDVLATLKKRGLTTEKVREIRALLQLVQKDRAPQKVQVLADSVKRANDEQLEAVERLRDWFQDWSSTLRTVLSAREQVQLGLLRLRGAASSQNDGEGDEDSSDEDNADESADDEAEADEG
jgi:hypothetical protein